MKQFGIPNYIGVYDNSLSKQDCQVLLNQFEKSPQQEGGFYTAGNFYIDHNYKKSIELKNTNFENGSVISSIIRPPLIDCITQYMEEYPSLKYIETFGIEDHYNFQKYDGEDDGYKVWHSDAGNPVCSNRILVWMFYLNKAKSGTEFMHYGIVDAKVGRCAIWPAGFTHAHKGVIPNKGVKYIVTGWVSFEKK